MRRHFMPPLILLLLFAFLTHAAANSNIREAEARLLWIVRDPERVKPAAIGDTARVLMRNFRVMLDRAEGRDLPLAAPLDLWTLAAGGSLFAARIGAITALFAAAAALKWLTRRLTFSRQWAGKLAAVALIAGAIALMLIFQAGRDGGDPGELMRRYQATRQPSEPVITVFRDDSPLGYYQAQMDLRRGVGIDLGWREFTPDEIAQAAAKLGQGPVWVIAPDEARFAVIDAALQQAGFGAVSFDERLRQAIVVRYDH